MILECACGKMYRVRDDAANSPTKCPVCGGTLRQAGGSSPSLAAEPKIKEQETRIRTLEQERNDAHARAERLEQELSGARPGPGLSQASAPLSDQVSELRAAAERADQLQREIFNLRSETERKLKDKDFEAAQARQAADREAAERRKLESRLNGLEENQARTLEGRQKTIDALDASVASYRSKTDELQKQLESQELQRLADLHSFENRVRDRDQQDRAELDRVGQSHQHALAQLRKDLEQKIADKDLQITDQRQAIDREAGERRRLSEVLSRLQENADRTVKEKQAALSAVEATLSSFKSKVESLQKRVNDLEQLRRAEMDAQAVRARSSQGARARLEEAGHFASDLDHNLDSVESLLSNLRERMRRLKDTITTPADPDPASPVGSASLARFEPSPSEPEPAPALSQAGFEFARTAPAPAEEAVEEELEPEVRGKVDAPSEVAIPAVRSAAPEPGPEPEEEALPEVEEARTTVAEATPLPAPPSQEAEEGVPLISPPDEEDVSSEGPAKKEAPAPPPKKEAPARPRFSWKRK